MLHVGLCYNVGAHASNLSVSFSCFVYAMALTLIRLEFVLKKTGECKAKQCSLVQMWLVLAGWCYCTVCLDCFPIIEIEFGSTNSLDEPSNCQQWSSNCSKEGDSLRAFLENNLVKCESKCFWSTQIEAKFASFHSSTFPQCNDRFSSTCSPKCTCKSWSDRAKTLISTSTSVSPISWHPP